MTEKITEQIKLHLPETMKRDIQDAAMGEDRKVSDWVRHVIALHLYGLKGSACTYQGKCEMRGDEGRCDD